LIVVDGRITTTAHREVVTLVAGQTGELCVLAQTAQSPLPVGKVSPCGFTSVFDDQPSLAGEELLDSTAEYCRSIWIQVGCNQPVEGSDVS
jgi:hypothetical protein